MCPNSVLVTVCESLREKFYVANPQMCVWLLFFCIWRISSHERLCFILAVKMLKVDTQLKYTWAGSVTHRKGVKVCEGLPGV